MAKNAEREEGRRTWTDEHMQTHGGRVSSRKKQTGSVWGSLCTSSAHYNSLKHLQRKVWRLHVEGLSWKKTTGRAASLPTIKPFTFIQNVDFITISLLICVQLKLLSVRPEPTGRQNPERLRSWRRHFDAVGRNMKKTNTQQQDDVCLSEDVLFCWVMNFTGQHHNFNLMKNSLWFFWSAEPHRLKEYKWSDVGHKLGHFNMLQRQTVSSFSCWPWRQIQTTYSSSFMERFCKMNWSRLDWQKLKLDICFGRAETGRRRLHVGWWSVTGLSNCKSFTTNAVRNTLNTLLLHQSLLLLMCCNQQIL